MYFFTLPDSEFKIKGSRDPMGLQTIWQKAGVQIFPYLSTVSFVEVAGWCKYKVEVTKKLESAAGFLPQKGRWQVERSFGWFNFFRRLSRYWEKTVESSATFIQIAFIDIILARFRHYRLIDELDENMLQNLQQCKAIL